MKRTKSILSTLLVLAMLLSLGCAAFASGEASGGASGGGSGGMGNDKSGDAELQAMIADVAPLFSVDEYTDTETGLTVEYNLYLPEGYDATTSYPMVVFIPDASVVGRGAEAVLTQGWGALIWATEEEQAKHPSIVIAPAFPVTILDDHTEYVTTDYVDLTPRMITALAEKYNADTDRVYVTGQSMGAMTFLYLAANHPDLFTAEMIVDGQWDVTTLSGLASQKFFYITAGGDVKASHGQTDVMEMFDKDGVAYSYSEGWDAQADADELYALVETELAEGNDKNFIRWEAGTVLNGGSGQEHMASFDYGYKLEAVRDWLFQQTKADAAADDTVKANNASADSASGEASSHREPVAEADIASMIAAAGDDADALTAVYKKLAIAYKEGDVLGANGEALPADYSKAVEYYRLAGELGDGYYYFDAGELYEKGLVTGTPDYAAAMECYILAAGSDHPNCKGVRNIGQWYETGNSYVQQDYRQAAAYYRWAIELDDVSSLSYMGNLYRQGYLSVDGEPDYENAALYYQRAADRGNDSAGGVAKSLYQLGLMYENGLGVDIDLDTSRELYQRAVDAGESKLEELYPDAVAALARVSK